MELEGLSFRMHNCPRGFPSLLFQTYPKSSFKVPKKPPKCSKSKVLNTYFSSSSVCALNVTEANLFTDLPVNEMEHSHVSNKNPLASDVKLKFGRNKVVNFDTKEKLKWFSSMLQTCAMKGYFRVGKSVHGSIVKSSDDPDSHLWCSLVNFYAKCGRFCYARKVLDVMPEGDVVSWTALLAGFVSGGCGRDAANLFHEMRKEGVIPNGFTFATGLKACSMTLDIDFGKQLHAEVVKFGTFNDIFVGSALVDLYAKCGVVGLAAKVFFCMPEHNAVSCNALLNAYAEVGDGEGVSKLFCRMTESEMRYSMFTLSTVLKGYANSGNLREGKSVHSLAIKIGCELDQFLSCSLLDMYSKCGEADDAVKVFVRIKDPDIVAWTAMITCLNQQGRNSKAAMLFSLLRQKGLKPNHFTLTSLVSAATELSDPRFGESVHACIFKYGFDSINAICNSLITMYMKLGLVQDGSRVFEALTERDLVSWNALLSGFHDNENCDQGPRIFIQMLEEGLKPNMYSFISILRSSSSLHYVEFGKQVHAEVIKNSLDCDCLVGTALLDMYAKSRCFNYAEVVFNRLNERDVFSWTVIIRCFAQSDQGEKAIAGFKYMQREGVKPNEFTLASCLSCCSSLAALENGRQLHSWAIKAGHFCDMVVASALLDMYGKCGCIEDAESLFKDSTSRDTISWNTIICGYAQNGHEVKALEAFRAMLDADCLPDEVTFTGVLSACGNMGLVEEGKYFFNSLAEIHGIKPTMVHYACMVNILGRAGKFDELESFIDNMEEIPDALIWQSVLGACKMHGNVELGEKAAEKLFELEPEIDSNYISMSNIFAAAGQWDNVANVRALMSSQGVKKEPGCSWVEVDSQINVFLAQDSSHPMIEEIHHKVKEMDQILASVGYVPRTECVLHDVPSSKKRGNLLYHSERLALAFALINTNPQKTIRIFKNLRICEDCHNVMKFLSKAIERKIIIRDVRYQNSELLRFRNVCSLKKQETDWILRIDIVEKGDELELLLVSWARLIVNAFWSTRPLGGLVRISWDFSDTDVAGYVAKQIDQLDMTKHENYSQDDLMNMNLGDQDADVDDDDDEVKVFREKESKTVDWKQRIRKGVQDIGRALKKRTQKAALQLLQILDTVLSNSQNVQKTLKEVVEEIQNAERKQIYHLEQLAVSDNLILVNRVNKRFQHGLLLDAAHVEAVNIIPNWI
ncbi:Pentatricopeptide repeat [Dillenia turbinata]|uniref:Pentatricopeptide repeat n=1 Tax=Dillenia turbinata TaxID=194707 RepID=A0AAN8ZL15_9MAGN